MARDAAPCDGVFINCPFDEDYAPVFRALIFTVDACGFVPRSARELDDAGQTRVDKLYAIIEECRYGVHDLSRTELDPDAIPYVDFERIVVGWLVETPAR